MKTPKHNPKPKTLFLSYECAPFIKMGGLGDVALGLPKALNKLGADIRVIIPYYSQIKNLKIKNQNNILKFKVLYDNKKYDVKVYQDYLPGSKVPIYFIKNKYFFERKEIFDKLSRDKFLFFQEAVLAFLKVSNWQPTILHCNDWHMGMLPLILEDKTKKDPFYRRFKTLYTIHNLAYQGDASPDVLAKIRLKVSDYESLTKDFLIDADIDFMYEGIAHANLINTVSPTYAKEILTKEYGTGLENLLNTRKKDIYGIINGIDPNDWDPKNDKNIQTFKHTNIQTYKNNNKIFLQKKLGLPVDEKMPVVSIITRLAYQKGLNLVLDWLKTACSESNSEASELDSEQKHDSRLPALALRSIETAETFQFIVLGDGDKKIENEFKQLEKKYPKNIRAVLKFDAQLANQIYAGSDMFLMPSRYEPCGLGQIISMRYGATPIVRETGGLKDTVSNYPKKQPGKGIGFTFKNFNSDEFIQAVNRALKIYQNTKEWQKMLQYNMKVDFSWNKPAQEYLKLYRKLYNSKQ